MEQDSITAVKNGSNHSYELSAATPAGAVLWGSAPHMHNNFSFHSDQPFITVGISDHLDTTMIRVKCRLTPERHFKTLFGVIPRSSKIFDIINSAINEAINYSADSSEARVNVLFDGFVPGTGNRQRP